VNERKDGGENKPPWEPHEGRKMLKHPRMKTKKDLQRKGSSSALLSVQGLATCSYAELKAEERRDEEALDSTYISREAPFSTELFRGG